METNDESFWLCKINPKVLEVLNQLLKVIEQLSMAPPKEEPFQAPHRLPGSLLIVDEAAQRLIPSCRHRGNSGFMVAPAVGAVSEPPLQS
jgi:hypothetical protein